MSEFYEDYSAEDIARFRRENLPQNGVPDPSVDIMAEAMDPESRAGLERFTKVFGKLSVTPSQGRMTALNSPKEVSPMSEQLKGTIEAKKVDGNRYGFKVGGKWASCFVNNDTPRAEEAKKLLDDLAVGDDATFSVYENKGYLNIDGVVEWAKGDPSKVPAKTGGYSFAKKAGGGGGRSAWKPEDKRASIVTMSLAYAKDEALRLLEGDDMKAQAPEAQVKFLTDYVTARADEFIAWTLKKLKDIGYKFPEGE